MKLAVGRFCKFGQMNLGEWKWGELVRLGIVDMLRGWGVV